MRQTQSEMKNAPEVAATGASSVKNPEINQGINMSNSTALTIGTTSVRQVGDLFSLNDLHQESGGRPGHRPGYFLDNEQTKALVTEIETAGIPAVKTKEGRGGGTYACKELVIAYAAWISAAFHLKVIRVFLKQMAPAVAQRNPAIDYDRISPAQAQDLKEIVQAIVDAGVQSYGETWTRLHNKFKVNSYLQLPATRHLEVRQYLIAKLPKCHAPHVAEDEPVAPKSKLDQAVLLQHAFTLASQTAAKVQQAVFSGVMSGNEDWKHSRYLVNLGVAGRDGDVAVQAKQIDSNACVLPINRFHSVIEDSITVDAQTLTQLAAVCMARLGQMAQRSTSPANLSLRVAA